MPILPVHEVREHLREVAADLERLQALLADAAGALLERFDGAAARLRAAPPEVDAALAELGGAVTALQFHDLAQQLLAHAGGRLARCDAGLAGDATPTHFAALAPSPVPHRGVAAGAVELF